MVVNEATCQGCKNCLLSCPFGAVELRPFYDNAEPVIQFNANEPKITAYKCDRCYRKDGPACVSACPHEALRVADLASDVGDKKLKAAISLAAAAMWEGDFLCQ
jgi:electron transport protein HydN